MLIDAFRNIRLIYCSNDIKLLYLLEINFTDMKTWIKWIIFLSTLVFNYAVGDYFIHASGNNSKTWMIFIIIGAFLTFASFILLLIPTNKREKERDFLKNYSGGGIGSLRGGMFN